MSPGQPTLAELIDPARCAVVTSEVQGAIVGPSSGLPAIAKAARHEAIPNMRRLLVSARASGIPVVHCTICRPADGRAMNTNCPMFAAHDVYPTDMSEGSEGASVIPELGPLLNDIVLTRRTGLGPMGGTDLDAVLRNLGATTIICVGVSVNIAIPNLVMDAVNNGYRVVLPRDAVAGVPREYAEQMIDNMLSMLATICRTDDILELLTRR